jgi:hypothetical protein
MRFVKDASETSHIITSGLLYEGSFLADGQLRTEGTRDQ